MKNIHELEKLIAPAAPPPKMRLRMRMSGKGHRRLEWPSTWEWRGNLLRKRWWGRSREICLRSVARLEDNIIYRDSLSAVATQLLLSRSCSTKTHNFFEFQTTSIEHRNEPSQINGCSYNGNLTSSTLICTDFRVDPTFLYLRGIWAYLQLPLWAQYSERIRGRGRVSCEELWVSKRMLPYWDCGCTSGVHVKAWIATRGYTFLGVVLGKVLGDNFRFESVRFVGYLRIWWPHLTFSGNSLHFPDTDLVAWRLEWFAKRATM